MARKQLNDEFVDELYTVKQAAKYLLISEPVLRMTIRCGKIPAQGKGKAMRVRKFDLLPFADPLAARRAQQQRDSSDAIKQALAPAA